jgi:hypothetical protein
MSAPVVADVGCVGGSLIVHFEAQPTARSVTLVLDDGRKVTSPVVLLSRVRGGPAALYFQVLPRSGPRPRRLIERDGSGRTIGVVAVAARASCQERPVEVIGTTRPLATLVTPAHRRLVIAAQHHVFVGRRVLTLQLSVAGRSGRVISSGGLRVAPGLEWEVQHFCVPSYYVVYGIVSAGKQRIGMRAGDRLVALGERAIPAAGTVKRRLVYGLTRAMPSELLAFEGNGAARVLLDIRGIVAAGACSQG